MKKLWLSPISLIVALTFIPVLAEANSGDFSGGVAIGTGYAGVSTAPTNGLIVQGSVGIGTTLPSYLLNIVGAAGAGIPCAAIQTLGTAYSDRPSFAILSPNYTAFMTLEPNTGILEIGTQGNDRISITSTGSVGINNTNPSYTLQVSGSVAGSSAYVNTSDIRYKKISNHCLLD